MFRSIIPVRVSFSCTNSIHRINSRMNHKKYPKKVRTKTKRRFLSQLKRSNVMRILVWYRLQSQSYCLAFINLLKVGFWKQNTIALVAPLTHAHFCSHQKDGKTTAEKQRELHSASKKRCTGQQDAWVRIQWNEITLKKSRNS